MSTPSQQVLQRSQSGKGKAKAAEFTCIVCEDNFDARQIYPAPCGHHYCVQDLEKLFRTAMKDISLYPPRCCRQPIPWGNVRPILSALLVRDFEAKKEELDDPEPAFCSVKTCSTHIPRSKRAWNRGTCPECKEQVCLLCRQKAHAGLCPEDEAVRETMELAAKQGWRKCPGCGRTVELSSGCYHMTCLCRTDFCYLCGKRWKSCDCIQFGEEYLLERAQALMERQGARDLERIMDEIAAQEEECVDHRWGRRTQEDLCDFCGDLLLDYIYVCADCDSRICRRCRYNRA